LIVALAIPFDAIRAVSLGYFVSRIENHRTATVNLIMQVCFVGFTITTIEMNGGVLGCFWSYLAATIISSSVAFGFTTSRVRFRPIVSLARWRDVVRKSFSIGIIQITNTVYLKLDTIILSLFLTSRSVALYGVATAIVAFFLVIPNMYMTSLVPIMAVAKLDEMPGILQRAISNMSAIGSLVAAGCICTGSGVVHLLAGTKFAGSATALSILSLSVILTAVSSVFGYALFAQDRHHRMVIVSVIVLFFNGGLNALVIPRYGVNGSAWAMIASEFIVLVGSYVIFKMKLSIRVDVARPLIRPIIAGTVTCLVVRELWQPAEIRVVALAAVIVSVAVLYVTVLALIGGIQRQAVVSLVRAGRQRLRSKVP
jgi:O-antigen/teichoic acid export membrane protein